MYKKTTATALGLVAFMSAASAQENNQTQPGLSAADECVIKEFTTLFNESRDSFISGNQIDIGIYGPGVKIFCEDKVGESTTDATDHLTSDFFELRVLTSQP